MSRYGIDTTSPASLLLQGFQTGANTAETRLRREQQQSQFNVEQQNYQAELAARAQREAEAKQQRQYAAEALHAAVMEQLGRTSGMRPTYMDAAKPGLGDVSGITMPDVLNEPMPDESDAQWKRAADAAKDKGNVEGLEVLLKEGNTREKRARNSRILRYFRNEYGGNPGVLADENQRMLYNVLESADDPASLVQRHYEQQDQERRMLARQQQAAALAAQQQQQDQAALEPAYRIVGDPNATPDQRAKAKSIIASRNAPMGPGSNSMSEMSEEEIDAALADVPDPERTRLKLAWTISGKRPAAGTVASQLGQGARQQATQQANAGKVARTAADKALATAEKEYRAIAGQSGKSGQLAPPKQSDIDNAKYASEGRSQFWTSESTEQKSLLKVQAWERYQQAKQARDAAYAGGSGTAPAAPAAPRATGESVPNYEDGPGSGVPGDPEPVEAPADADTVVLELMDKGLSDEEIAAELRRRGFSP